MRKRLPPHSPEALERRAPRLPSLTRLLRDVNTTLALLARPTYPNRQNWDLLIKHVQRHLALHRMKRVARAGVLGTSATQDRAVSTFLRRRARLDALLAQLAAFTDDTPLRDEHRFLARPMKLKQKTRTRRER